MKTKSLARRYGLHCNLTLAQARDKLAQMAQRINRNEMKRKAIADEKAKTDQSRNKPTLKAASDNYLSHKNLKPRSIKVYSIVVNDYQKDWNHLKLDDISRTMIQTKHSEL